MDKQDENHDESQPETDGRKCVLHPSAPKLEEKVKWDKEDPLCAMVTWEGTPSENEEVYKLYCWTDETDKREFETHGRQYSLTKLKKGSMYFVNAIQINKAGCSVPSNTIKFETGPKMPVNIQVMNYEPSPHDHLMVQFDNANTRQVDHLISVQPISGGEIEPIQTKRGQNFALIKGLTPGQYYSIQVAAVVGDLKSDFANFPRMIQTYPGVPVDVKTEKFHDGVKLSWKHNEIRPKNYRIFWAAIGDMQEVIETREDYFYFNKLKRSTIYKFRVAALNAAGESEKSAEIEYVSALSPPEDIKTSNIPHHRESGILVSWKGCDGAIKYEIGLMEVATSQAISRKTTKKCSCKFYDLKPNCEYMASVRCISNNQNRNSTLGLSNTIWTCPCKISNIQAHKDSTNSQIISWNKVQGATSYNVQLKKKGIAPVTHPTTANYIHFGDLELNCQYSVSVTALNSGGFGEESEKILFETALYPVKSVQVENSMKNPTTELIVRIEGSKASSTAQYKLRFINLNEGTVKKYKESGDIIKMSGLHEGTKYKVGVTSVHETDEELNSEEIMSDPIWTLEPSLVVETMSISHEEQKFTWNNIVNVLEYGFHWRIEHRRWQQEIVYQDEFILENLEPGKKYEVYVTAINDSGEGEESSIVPFVTVPAVPTDLQQQILSTQEVKISCKSCEGADGYIFIINNKSYDSKISEYTLQCEDQVDLEVTVQSYNDAGKSNLSDGLKFRQVVRLVQQNFKQMAETRLNRNMFVTPKLIKVSSSDVIEDLRLLATQTKEGGTIMLMGQNFTGKTACCSYILQHVPNAKLAYFLDYEEVKTLKTKFNVKSILHKYMSNLSEEEMDFVFHWMKKNSNQIVLIVDNFNVSPEFNSQNLFYETEGLPNQIFYNLLVTNRQVFPKSQVFFSTACDSMKQFLNPTLSLNIDGFDDTGIMNMKKKILGEKSDIVLPDALRFFCTVPGFCESILYMRKNNKIEADPNSFSSILVQHFLENLNRYPPVQKKVKINHLWQKINDVPKIIKSANINPEKVKKRKDRPNSQSQVATSVMESSINSGGLSFSEFDEGSGKSSTNCDNLQKLNIIAMYFALFCKYDDFKRRLRKKSLKFGSFVKIWIMIAGLLREKTVETAKKIFEPAEIMIDETEVAYKRDVMKNFIKENIGNILKQIYIQPQITLDWFSICNELNDDKLFKMCEKKIEITDKSTTDEVDKAADFLRRLPKKFCSNVKVKYACNDATKTWSIDSAIKENPNGNLIPVNSEGSKSNKRNPSKYQSRSGTDNQMSPALSPTSPMDNGFPEISEDAENTSLVMENQLQQGPDLSVEPDNNSIHSHDAPSESSEKSKQF